MRASAAANANIALIKYWGKRDEELHLPLNSSISLTLDGLTTNTTIEFTDAGSDELTLDGIKYSEGTEEFNKVRALLDIVRKQYSVEKKASVTSSNSFPTAAGLASSASGFAALAVAIDKALNLRLSKRELSILARRGSGSASRSVFGGFVEWRKGSRPDGSDSYSEQLYPDDYWPQFRVIVCMTDKAKKVVSSRQGMAQSVKTSPMYKAWLADIEQDLTDMRLALKGRDFTKLGQTAELNCLKMHATMWTTNPPIIYHNEASIRLMHAVKELRESGTECYFTQDAGPQIKVLCLENNLKSITNRLEREKAILLVCKPGAGASVV